MHERAACVVLRAKRRWSRPARRARRKSSALTLFDALLTVVRTGRTGLTRMECSDAVLILPAVVGKDIRSLEFRRAPFFLIPLPFASAKFPLDFSLLL